MNLLISSPNFCRGSEIFIAQWFDAVVTWLIVRLCILGGGGEGALSIERVIKLDQQRLKRRVCLCMYCNKVESGWFPHETFFFSESCRNLGFLDSFIEALPNLNVRLQKRLPEQQREHCRLIGLLRAKGASLSPFPSSFPVCSFQSTYIPRPLPTSDKTWLDFGTSKYGFYCLSKPLIG